MSISKLNHLCLVKISGDDATSFLQGQLTNDIDKLTNSWHYSGYCNPKGRLLAIFQLWKDGDAFYALVDKSVVEQTIRRLKMYVLRSKVSIEELAEANCYGSFEQQDHPMLSSIETAEVAIDTDEGITVLSLGSRFVIISPENELAIPADGPDTSEQWLQQDILEGLPRVTTQSVELFIPQMLNLDILNGISFKKGCYTGQEIVARMHYLGKLKQRQYLCEFTNSEHKALIGEKVFIADHPTKSAGTIANALDNYQQALVVLRTEFIDNTEFRTERGESLKLSTKQPVCIPE